MTKFVSRPNVRMVYLLIYFIDDFPTLLTNILNKINSALNEII